MYNIYDIIKNKGVNTMPTDNKNVNLAVSDELLDKLKELARASDRSLSAQIRFMLTQYLKDHADD